MFESKFPFFANLA